MYGDGNTTKMVGDITTSMSQIMNGIEDATGLNVASMLQGIIAGQVTGQATGKAMGKALADTTPDEIEE